MVAPAAIAGALQGFMQGYDYQQALDRRRAQEDAEAQRQAELDQRQATVFQQSQADRSHMLERRPVLEQRADQTYGLNAEILKQRQQAGAFELKRQPQLAAQQDASFATGQRADKAQIRAAQLRAQAAQLGLDAKQVELEREEIRDAMGAGFAAYRMSGDPSSIEAAWNKTAAQSGMSPIKNLTKNKDGSFTLQMADTKPMLLKNEQHLLGTIATAMDPSNFMQIYMMAQKAKHQAAAERTTNPGRFYDTIKGENGQNYRLDIATGKAVPITGPNGQPIVSGSDKTAEEIADELYRSIKARNPYLPEDEAIKSVQEYMAARRSNFGAGQAPSFAAPSPGGAGAAPTGIPAQAVQMLRGSPTPDMRAYFDATFGAGSAAAVLGQ